MKNPNVHNTFDTGCDYKVNPEFVTTNFNCPGRTYQIKNKNIKEAILSLGISMAPAFGWSITVPHNHVAQKALGKNHPKRTFSELKHSEQIKYILDHVMPAVVTPFAERGIVFFELTKSKVVHAHCICWHPEVLTRPDMDQLRDDVNTSVVNRSMTQGKLNLNAITNQIHFLEKVSEHFEDAYPELADHGYDQETRSWIGYISKDLMGNPRDKFNRFGYHPIRQRAFFPYIWHNWDKYGKDKLMRTFADLILSEEEIKTIAEKERLGLHVPVHQSIQIPSVFGPKTAPVPIPLNEVSKRFRKKLNHVSETESDADIDSSDDEPVYQKVRINRHGSTILELESD